MMSSLFDGFYDRGNILPRVIVKNIKKIQKWQFGREIFWTVARNHNLWVNQNLRGTH